MKGLLWMLAVLLLQMPVLAQDDDAQEQQPAFGGGGGGQTQVFTRVDTINPMDQVKEFLAKAQITLDGDQEKAVQPAAEAALKEAQDLTERMREQFAARGQRGPGAEGGERRGGPGFGGGNRRGRADGTGGRPRGAGFGANNPNNPMMAELRRINDELIMKINDVLRPDQQAALKNFQNDQIRKGGGFPALRLAMEEAGAPLTAEQAPQVQAVYREEAQQRLQLMREGRGQPDPAKVLELEKTTMGKIAKLLTPAQRKALLESRKAQSQ